MLKFSPTDKIRLQTYIDTAHAWQGKLADDENVMNEAIKAATATFNARVEAYNEFRNEVTSFIEDIMTNASDEYDERSERWQEGDKGCAAAEWIEQLNNFILTESIDLLEIEASNAFEQDGFYDELSELPTAPME